MSQPSARTSISRPSQTHLPHMMEWSWMNLSTYKTPRSRNSLTNIVRNERIRYNNGLKKLLPAMANINCVVVNPARLSKSLGVTLDDKLKLVCNCMPLELLPDPAVDAYPTVTGLLPQHWCIRSSQAEFLLITVTVCSHLHQHIKLTNYNVCWMQRLACCSAYQDLSEIFKSRSRTNFIGCVSWSE